MADELKIRLQIEEQVVQTSSTTAGASAAAQSGQASKLGTSAGFGRRSSFWELDMERIQHRLFHSVARSSLRLFGGMAIGDLVGTGLGDSFVGNLGARIATGFAFGGPTGVAIGVLHTLIEGVMEQVREASRKIEDALKKVQDVKAQLEDERKDRKERNREMEDRLRQEISEINDKAEEFARQLQYETFQLMR